MLGSLLILSQTNLQGLKGRGVALHFFASIFLMPDKELLLKYMPVLASCQNEYVSATSCNLGGVDTTEKNRQWMIDLLHPVWIILGGLTDTN